MVSDVLLSATGLLGALILLIHIRFLSDSKNCIAGYVFSFDFSAKKQILDCFTETNRT